MKIIADIKLWTCPKCGRRFAKRNQSHSCKVFPIEKHFEGKKKEKELYNHLIQSLTRHTGPFSIDSVECCIHLVANTTFASVKVMRNKIRIEFLLPRMIKKQRLKAAAIQPYPHSNLYVVDVNDISEIDDELTGWIKEAYEEKAVTKTNN